MAISRVKTEFDFNQLRIDAVVAAAERKGNIALHLIEKGNAEFAALVAREAATLGAKALEIIADVRDAKQA